MTKREESDTALDAELAAGYRHDRMTESNFDHELRKIQPSIGLVNLHAHPHYHDKTGALSFCVT